VGQVEGRGEASLALREEIAKRWLVSSAVPSPRTGAWSKARLRLHRRVDAARIRRLAGEAEIPLRSQFGKSALVYSL